MRVSQTLAAETDLNNKSNRISSQTNQFESNRNSIEQQDFENPNKTHFPKPTKIQPFQLKNQIPHPKQPQLRSQVFETQKRYLQSNRRRW